MCFLAYDNVFREERGKGSREEVFGFLDEDEGGEGKRVWTCLDGCLGAG